MAELLLASADDRLEKDPHEDSSGLEPLPPAIAADTPSELDDGRRLDDVPLGEWLRGRLA